MQIRFRSAFLIAFALLLVASGLATSFLHIPALSAQIDPTAQQQTVEAMVMQMLVATQFAAAQTGTAQAIQVGTAAPTAEVTAGFMLPVATSSPTYSTELSPTRAGSTIVVNSLADDPRGCPRTCTLRSAISSAQPGDIIAFDSSLSGLIVLSQPLTIDKDLTINGPGADVLAIEGDGQSDILTMSGFANLDLSGLTLQNAEDSSGWSRVSAIRNHRGRLILADVAIVQATLVNDDQLALIEGRNVEFRENRAAISLYNAGTARLHDSLFLDHLSSGSSAYGFATVIFNSGTLTLSSSRVENNLGTVTVNNMNNRPRTVVNRGTLTIENTTFISNSGGTILSHEMGTLTITSSLLAANDGQGIGVGNGRVVISNSTLTGHTGAALVPAGETLITNSTIAGNPGGGITNSRGTVRLSSSIVADNGTLDVSGNITSLGNNLIGNPGDTTGWFASDVLNADPLLAPLGDYGGTTQTMALYDGSPAIGAGYCVGDADIPAVTTDQRGVARKDPCDIGAYETEAGNALIAPTPTPMPTATLTPTPTITPTLQPTFTSTPATMGVFRIVPSESLVRFTILEEVRGVETLTVGTTDQVEGEIVIDFAQPANAQVSTVRINASTLATDDAFRDRAIRAAILETAQFPYIEFAPIEIIGLPNQIEVNEQIAFQIVGDLTIRDTTRYVTFDVTAIAATSNRIEGAAHSTVTRSQFELTIPAVPGVANVSDDVTLEFNFVAEAKSVSNGTNTRFCQTYVLQPGDTLASIADDNGASLADLLNANRLTEADAIFLQVGQVLIIPLEGCIHPSTSGAELQAAQAAAANPTQLPVETVTENAPATSPENVAERWVYSVLSGGLEEMRSLSCPVMRTLMDSRPDSISLLGGAIMSRFGTNQALNDPLYERVTETGQRATIRVTGTMEVDYGYEVRVERIDTRLEMLYQGGDWLFCEERGSMQFPTLDATFYRATSKPHSTLPATLGSTATVVGTRAATATPMPTITLIPLSIMPTDTPVMVPTSTSSEAPVSSDELRQWAIRVDASSEYSDSSYSAAQVLGSPDSSPCIDTGTAWSRRSRDTRDSLTVYFDQPVNPSRVNIHQIYDVGAITSIELIPFDGSDPIPVPDSKDPGLSCNEVFSIPISIANLPPVNGVRINLAQGLWNEIDAVELVGTIGSIGAPEFGENATPAVSSPSATPLANQQNYLITATVAVDVQLNMRSGPGTAFEVVAILAPGTKVNVLSTDSSRDWYRIQLDDASGWVMSRYVTVDGDPAQIPVDVSESDK